MVTIMKNKTLEFNPMNYWKFVKEEIFRIANITLPEMALQEIKKLNKFVNSPKIEYRHSGNYTYFYIMKWVYDPKKKKGRRTKEENLGRIKREKFESNKKKLLKMSVKKLKEYLEKY